MHLTTCGHAGGFEAPGRWGVFGSPRGIEPLVSLKQSEVISGSGRGGAQHPIGFCSATIDLSDRIAQFSIAVTMSIGMKALREAMEGGLDLFRIVVASETQKLVVVELVQRGEPIDNPF